MENRFAGSGTTANTLVFLTYAVANDRRIYKLLREELDNELSDADFEPTPPLVQKLPYTNAIILEALRRYPTIPGLMPRIIKSPITVEGITMPVDVRLKPQTIGDPQLLNF
jgi:cytochrome P450